MTIKTSDSILRAVTYLGRAANHVSFPFTRRTQRGVVWAAVLALHINSTQEAWRCAIGNVEQQRGDSREPIRGWECRGGVVVIDDGNQSAIALNGALWRHTHQSLVREAAAHATACWHHIQCVVRSQRP